MKMIDSHSHLFLEEFLVDLPQVIERARIAGISHILMPNIDSTTIESMLATCDMYKGYCFPMIGLHPTSVGERYEQELNVVIENLNMHSSFIAIGEIGIDLYWDKTYLEQQLVVFERQVQLALEYHLPIVIHCREAFDYIYNVLSKYKNSALTGVFHSFMGTIEEAELIMELGNFMFGINGVITFKKSFLPDTLKTIPLERIILETDSPYLAPVPHRGKRNESAFLKDVLAKVAEVYQLCPEIVAAQTSENVIRMFGIR
ncbi:TatD family hydrolase [Bacteroides ihuae]|uniref:TatD family hydrolase n=1 Tax=Bacteroides ihuae TaxID=1852362 RepID=UPI0008D9D361|nr:TatD family hydrolase [Bacteroides ihuae]